MKTILVDDEELMIRSFIRQSGDIRVLDIVGTYTYPEEALEYVRHNEVELAVLDIEMPGMSGIGLASELRRIRPDIMIVFITAYDNYLRDANEINADYYLLKPYTSTMIEQMAQRMELIRRRQKKPLYLQMFGVFTVKKNGEVVPLVGKAKEILAFVAARRGKEISNEEIYSALWPDRPYDNDEMKVYYNALKRLKTALEAAGIRSLLISTRRGQIINTALADCDYYQWLDNRDVRESGFNGEFLSEYSWSMEMEAQLLTDLMKDEE